MADNPITPSAPTPNAETAGVSAVLRVRFDLAKARADLAGFEAEMLDEVRRTTRAVSQELGAALAQATLRASRAGSTVLDDEGRRIARLVEKQQQLAAGFGTLANVQTGRKTLELEQQTLSGLVANASLIGKVADQARARLSTIDGELVRITERENRLTQALAQRSVQEQRLAARVNLPSESSAIAERVLNQDAINGKARVDAARRVQTLINQTEKEAAAQRLAQAATESTADATITNQRVSARVKAQQVAATKEKAILDDLIKAYQSDKLTPRQQRDEQARLQAQRLRTELSQLRAAQNLVNEAFQRGDITATQQGQAWLAAERRAKTLENQIRQLDAQAERSNRALSQSTQNAGRGIPGASLLRAGFVGGVVGGITSAVTTQGLQAIETGLRNIGDVAIGFPAKLETASVALKQFVANKEGVQILSDEFLKFAAASPFGLDKILDGARRLLAMGTAADQVLPRLRTISAAVASIGGNEEVFKRVILAITQIGAKAKIMSQEVRQLSEAGIPAARILQEELGLTSEQVQNIGKQSIDSATALDAIMRGLDKRFGQGILLTLDTFQGRLSNLGTVFEIFAGKIGAPATQQFKLLFEQLARLLQDPGTLASAEALGDVIGNIIKNLRDDAFSDTGGFLTFLRELPNIISEGSTKLLELENLLNNFKGITVDVSGPHFDFGTAPELNAKLEEINALIAADAHKIAEESAKKAAVSIDLTATIDKIKLDAAHASVTGLDSQSVDLSGFTQPVSDEVEHALTEGLSAASLKSVQGLLTFVDAELKNNGVAAHIAGQIRQQFISELSKLGDNPSVAQLQAATNRLAKALTIPGQFTGTDAAGKAVLAAAKAYFELGNQESRLVNIQQSLQDLQTADQAASERETRTIDQKTASLKELTDAQKTQHDANAQEIDDIEARNSRTSGAFTTLIENQARIERDLRDARNSVEDKFTAKIDAATAAQNRNNSAIKTAQLDLRENLRIQDEELDRIESKYRAQLKLNDAEVNKQNRALRAAQREFDRADLEREKAILAARQRGDTDAVKRLQQQREAARIAFDESQAVARAQLQVAQDDAQAVRDQQDAEQEAAQAKKTDIQRTGQANIDRLQREGEQLDENKTKVELERDAALQSYDRKIKIAQAFAELLGRSKSDIEAIQKQDLLDAKARAADADDRADAIIKPLQAELDHLKDIHTTNDNIRTDEELKSKAVETGVQRRITALNAELAKLKEIQAIDDLRQQNAGQQTVEGQPKPSNIVQKADTVGIIQGAINTLPAKVKADLEAQLAALRKQFADTGKVDQKAFEAFARQLVDVLNKAGLSNLTGTEIKQFIIPQTESKILVDVPGDVRQLLAAIEIGDKELVGKLLSRAGILEALVRSLVGTDKLVGSEALRRELEASLPKLQALSPDLAAAVIKELAARGITLDTSGGVNVPTAAQQQAVVASQTQSDAALIQSDAASRQLEAAKIQQQLAQQAAGTPATTEESAKKALADFFGVDKIPPLLSIGPVNIPSPLVDLFKNRIQEAIGTPQFPNPAQAALAGVAQEAIRNDLRNLLETTGGMEKFTKDLKVHADQWRLILERIGAQQDPRLAQLVDLATKAAGIQGTVLPPALDSLIHNIEQMAKGAGPHAANTALTSFLSASKENRAKFAAEFKDYQSGWQTLFTTLQVERFPQLKELLDQSLRENRIDPAALVPTSTAVAAQVDANVVQPVKAGLDQLPPAAADAGNAAVGPDGLGAMNSEDNQKTLAGTGVAASQALAGGVTATLPANLKAAMAVGLGVSGLAAVGTDANLIGLLVAVGQTIAEQIAGGTGAELINQAPSVLGAFAVEMATELESTVIAGEADFGAVGKAAAQQVTAGFDQELRDSRPPQNVTGKPAGLSAPVSPSSQGFIVPIAPGPNAANPQGITDFFGAPRAGGKTHTGIDIRPLKAGEAIHAAADGTVVQVGNDPGGYGNYCIILHDNGLYTLYGHMLNPPSVKVGERVTQGQTIGIVGSTGNSSGPHLHFEVRQANKAQVSNIFRDTTPLNPLRFLPAFGGANPFPDSITGDIPGGSRATTTAQSAVDIIRGIAKGVKDAGGDFQVVLDAFLSGATTLTADRLKGFSTFAQAEMIQAFQDLQLALQFLGGGTPDTLRNALIKAGLLPSNPKKVESVVDKFMREMFPDGLPTVVVRGFLQGIDEEKVTAAWQEFFRRHPDLAALGPQGQIDVNAQADRADTAAQEAARQIREFALAHQFVPGRTDEAGKPVLDPVITQVLQLIKSLPSDATIADLLAKLQGNGPDDTRFTEIANLIAKLQAENPDLTIEALQGFLFGGPGFEAADQVAATNANTDAIDNLTAVMLGAQTIDQIEVWKALLHEYRRVTPDIATIAANSEEAVQAAVDTATNTAQTADNTDPTNGATSPTATLPDNTGQQVIDPLQKLHDAQAALQLAEERVQALSADFERAVQSGNAAEIARIRRLLDAATANRDQAQALVNELEQGTSADQAARDDNLERKAEFTLEKYKRKLDEARARHDETAVLDAERRIKQAENTLDEIARRRAARDAGQPATGSQTATAPTTTNTVPDPQKAELARQKLALAEERVQVLSAELELAFQRGNQAEIARIRRLLAEAEANRDKAKSLFDALSGQVLDPTANADQEARDAIIERRAQFTIEKYKQKLDAARAAGDTAAANEASRRIKAAEAALEGVEARRAAREAAAVDGAKTDAEKTADTIKTPTEQYRDSLKDSVESIRREIELRGRLNAVLDRQLNGTPLATGSTTGGSGSSGGGGGKAESQTFTQINNNDFSTSVTQSADPIATAAAITNQQQWAARRWGDRLARK